MNIVAFDDNEINLSLLEAAVSKFEVDFISFTDPEEGLKVTSRMQKMDVALVDYMMPKVDGIEVIRRLRNVHPDSIYIMITAVSDDQGVKIRALKAGATDFLGKPLDIIEFQNRLKNLIQLKKNQNILMSFNQTLRKEVSYAVETVQERNFETLDVLSQVAEYKDPETANHINRVAYYSKMLAEKVGLDPSECEIVFHSSPLHDLGKVGIPDEILLKPGRLTEEQFEVMKTHAQIGFHIMQSCQNPFLKAGAIICLSHHEKYERVFIILCQPRLLNI